MQNPAPPSAPQGTRLVGTPYRLVGPAGKGGMGIVHLAIDDRSGEEVVLKMLPPGSEQRADLVERLRMEAQVVTNIDHPHVVKGTGLEWSAEAGPFFVMERLVGHTLAQDLMESGAPPLLQALEDMLQLLAGLAAAHASGIVHRDIKPGNVFVDQRTGTRQLKIIDFGVAKLLPGFASLRLPPLKYPTDKGAILGTPRFLSPEQARSRDVDPRSDLYSAAIVLYALLTGRLPFEHARTRTQSIAAHLKDIPKAPSLQTQRPIPIELDRVIHRALAKDPSLRFQTAEDMSRALETVLHGLKQPAGSLDTCVFSLDLCELESVRTAKLGSESPPAQPPSVADDKATGPSLRADVADATPDFVASGVNLAAPTGQSLVDTVQAVRMEQPVSSSTGVVVRMVFIALVTAAGATGIVALLLSWLGALR